MSITLKQQKLSNGVKSAIKKISKFIISRMFYLLIGLFFAVAIPVAYSAWNSTVGSGDPLTSSAWNEHVNKLIELNSRTTNLENRTPSHVDCYEVNLTSTASCNSGYFFTYIERSYCPGAYCKGTCCKPW